MFCCWSILCYCRDGLLGLFGRGVSSGGQHCLSVDVCRQFMARRWSECVVLPLILLVDLELAFGKIV